MTDTKLDSKAIRANTALSNLLQVLATREIDVTPQMIGLDAYTAIQSVEYSRERDGQTETERGRDNRETERKQRRRRRRTLQTDLCSRRGHLPS